MAIGFLGLLIYYRLGGYKVIHLDGSEDANGTVSGKEVPDGTGPEDTPAAANINTAPELILHVFL